MLLMQKLHLSQFHSYYPKRGTKLLEVTKYYVLGKSAICIYNGLFCIFHFKKLTQKKAYLPTWATFFFFSEDLFYAHEG